MAGATRLLPAYLVVGPDELKRKQTVTRLRAHVEGPFADFNLEELVASADMEPVGVLSSLNTLPMGGDLRVVIIENAGKLPKPVSEAVIEYLKAPNESCTLLLVAETLAKSTRLYKAVAKVGPRSVIECGAPKRRDLTPYVQKLAAAHGVGIAADAASELVSRVGESTTMLDNQLSALSALLGGQGQLTRAFVEQNVARTAEVKPWEFLDRIAERDARRSFELLALLRGNSAIGLLSLVTGRIRELICARALMARGDARGIAAALGKADWQVRGHARNAGRFAEGELEGLLVECARARSRKIKVNYHDSKTSFLEGVFAKGDRRLAPVILEAYKRGCYFDGWDECFRYDTWMQTFEDLGVDPFFYCQRPIGLDEVTPWSHMDYGVTHEYLVREYQKALAAQTTQPCNRACHGCGANHLLGGPCFDYSQNLV